MIEVRNATVLLRMLNLSSNVLDGSGLIEGWTAECIFSLEYYTAVFFGIKEEEAMKHTPLPVSSRKQSAKTY